MEEFFDVTLQKIGLVLTFVGVFAATKPIWVKFAFKFLTKRAMKALVSYLRRKQKKTAPGSVNHERYRKVAEAAQVFCDIIQEQLGLKVKPKQMEPGYRTPKQKITEIRERQRQRKRLRKDRHWAKRKR